MVLDVSNVISVDGEWYGYRQAGYRYPALWLPPLRAHGKPQPSARWHTEGDSVAQYIALGDYASWAELVRFEGIRTEDERRYLLFNLWRLRVRERKIANLATFDLIAQSGLAPAKFVDDDHSYCRTLAGALGTAGFRGVLSPSAAYPDAINLTLFGPRRECKMEEQNRWPDHYIGCHLAAERTAPPLPVLEKVRYREEPHVGLYEWERSLRSPIAVEPDRRVANWK
jgi:RES domain